MYSLKEMIDLFVLAGENKVNKPLKSQILLGMFAGGLIGLGYIAMLGAIQTLGGSVGIFVGSFLFPMALLSILIFGGELVTSNGLIVGLAYLHKKVTFKQMIENWIVIFIANLVGAIIVGLTIVYLGIFDQSIEVVDSIIFNRLALGPIQLVVSGILCSIFVAIAAWMFNAAQTGTVKIISMWLPISVFALVGFQHCIANAVLYTLGLCWNLAPLSALAFNLIFVFVGNVLGGLIFVGILLNAVNNANINNLKDKPMN